MHNRIKAIQQGGFVVSSKGYCVYFMIINQSYLKIYMEFDTWRFGVNQSLHIIIYKLTKCTELITVENLAQ